MVWIPFLPAHSNFLFSGAGNGGDAGGGERDKKNGGGGGVGGYL